MDQLKRAVVSIVLNIAEGYGRGIKHYRNYLKISYGSVNEVVAILQIIQEVHNIDTSELQDEYKYLAKQISAFAQSIKLKS